MALKRSRRQRPRGLPQDDNGGAASPFRLRRARPHPHKATWEVDPTARRHWAGGDGTSETNNRFP